MKSLALLLIGFSVFSALVLALTHFREAHYEERRLSRCLGQVLLLALGFLQLAHYAWLALDLAWVEAAGYRATLFVVAPAFYLFARPLLDARSRPALTLVDGGHALPVAVAPWLPGELALPLAFAVGAGYLAWLARGVYRLRRQRAGFQRELVLLGAVFAIAVGVAGLGLFEAKLPDRLFFTLYAIAIGLAFLLVQITLGLRPRLSTEVCETAQVAYLNSTLGKVDCDAALTRLAAAMGDARLYADPALNLPALAERLGLSGHQLSELINTRLGKGFSRYLRERRVEAAKAMLLAEPAASVLSVGLAVGFTAQSNFYEAFREIEGTTPGQYRKARSGAGSSPAPPAAGRFA